ELAKMFLQEMQQPRHRRPFVLRRVVRDDLVDVLLEFCWNGQCHGKSGFYRSHSPITKSMLARMVTMSLIMWPLAMTGSACRFTNDGARIFSRCGVPPPLLTM